jgi:serine/threonine protein kinase
MFSPSHLCEQHKLRSSSLRYIRRPTVREHGDSIIWSPLLLKERCLLPFGWPLTSSKHTFVFQIRGDNWGQATWNRGLSCAHQNLANPKLVFHLWFIIATNQSERWYQLHCARRDIKEDNVFIDSQGYARIANFGLSHVLRDGVTRTVCGTPEYRAPEVWRGLRYSTSVDWWALGVMAYTILVGVVSGL